MDWLTINYYPQSKNNWYNQYQGSYNGGLHITAIKHQMFVKFFPFFYSLKFQLFEFHGVNFSHSLPTQFFVIFLISIFYYSCWKSNSEISSSRWTWLGQMTNEDDIEFFLFTVHLLNTNWYRKSEEEFSYKELSL